MKVLLVARHPVGGIRTYIRYVYSEPVMADVQVTLIAPALNKEDVTGDQLQRENMTCIATASTLWAIGWTVLRYARQHRPSIIHSHGFTSAMLATPVAKLLRIPHIITLHDVFLSGQFTGYKGTLKKWLVEKILNRADGINPVGEDAATNLETSFPSLRSSESITTIRNGVNSRYFLANDRRPIRQELNIAKETLVIGFFGRFMAQKGFSLLRDAVEGINQAADDNRVVVVCFGWGGFIREEQEMLKQRKISQYFHFLPGTSDMVEALRGVDMVVMPSRWEACPLLPMEAMIAGTVLVASDCVGLKEVTDNTPAIRFESGSVSALQQSLCQVMGDMNKHRESALAFRQEAAARFDVEETAKALRSLYYRYQGKLGYSH